MNLPGPPEWDPSVLDFTHPSDDGEPPWSNDLNERFAFDLNFDEFRDYTQRAIQTLCILDDSSLHLTPCSTFRANQYAIRSNQHVINNETLTMKSSGFILVGSMYCSENHGRVHRMGNLHTQYLPYEKAPYLGINRKCSMTLSRLLAWLL